MERYRGETLPAGTPAVVIVNDALGNFVAASPLLQMMKAAGLKTILYCGRRVWEFVRDNPLFESAYPVFGTEPSEIVKLLPGAGGLVVNLENTCYAKAIAAVACRKEGFVCGPCVDLEGRAELPFPDDPRGALWSDPEWIAEDLTARYPFLESGFIGEIFCRLAYFDGPIPLYHVPLHPPPFDPPEVLIATSASLKDKLWPLEKWRLVLARLNAEGRSVGLLGAKPTEQSRYWIGYATEERLVDEGLVHDLRGRLALPEVVGALSACRAVLTIDNGILHLACAARTPTVGIFRYGIHRLWAPPVESLRVLTPVPGEAVATISEEAVFEAMLAALA